MTKRCSDNVRKKKNYLNVASFPGLFSPCITEPGNETCITEPGNETCITEPGNETCITEPGNEATLDTEQITFPFTAQQNV